jgi:nickel-dependent lactate racemase
MQTIGIPWASWYGDATFELSFPDAWRVEEAGPQGGQDIGEEGIRRAYGQPVGAPSIRELARGKKSAVVVIDDLTRATPTGRLMAPLLEELAAGGISRDEVVVLVGLGAHRALSRQDLIRKLGQELVDFLDIRNHDPYENLTRVGTSSGGTPIELSSDYMGAELKIAVGGIVPHGLAGFGGGAKMVVPGVASMDTIEVNHRPTDDAGGLRTAGVGAEMVELSWGRRDMEDVARLAGLDAIVNAVFTPAKGVAGLFVGDMVAAHRRGVEFAKGVYATPHPGPADVAICNAYPEDTELIQSGKGLYILQTSTQPVVVEGGTVVLATAASEGMGFHHWVTRQAAARPQGDGRASFNPRGGSVIFSPNVTPAEFGRLYSDGVEFHRDWGEVVQGLEELHGAEPRVVVFPCGSMQVMVE